MDLCFSSKMGSYFFSCTELVEVLSDEKNHCVAIATELIFEEA